LRLRERKSKTIFLGFQNISSKFYHARKKQTHPNTSQLSLFGHFIDKHISRVTAYFISLSGYAKLITHDDYGQSVVFAMVWDFQHVIFIFNYHLTELY